jgi:rRNA methylases
METITSKSNERVKLVKKLADKKYRDELGLYVVEGLTLLKDMPESVKVQAFFVTEGIIEQAESIVSKYRAEIISVSQGVMNYIADTVTPSGILAVIRRESGAPTGAPSIVLDRVSDSGNVGTLIRTAAAFGYTDVYLVNTADAYSSKVARSSMGGLFKVNLIEATEKEVIASLKNHFKIALDMDGASIESVQAKAPVALFLGSEAHGLSDGFVAAADAVASISMLNEMESLNVAVAGAISMYKFSAR